VLLLGLGGAGVRVAMLMPGSGDDLQATFESSAAEAATSIAQTTEAYATGGFAEVFAERAREWGRMIGFGMFFAGPQLLALFLLGYALGRSGFARRLDEEAPRIVHWLPRLAAAGLLGSLLMVVAELFSRPDLPTLLGWLGLVGMMFGAPALALAYASGLVLLMREPAWRRRLARLGAVGRMALTNYLTHSLVVTTLAYGYGGGLYGKISPAAGVPIVVAIFGFQLGFSPWWLARFRFGPVEWLWRSLTYGERQPMRRQTALETP